MGAAVDGAKKIWRVTCEKSMKKLVKFLIILIFVIFIGLQFFRPDRTNPPIIENETLESTISVPKEIGEILKRSCKDCHSNETVYPWYSNFAPISWTIVDHIKLGREELNFSNWGTYSIDKKERKLEEICEEIEAENMPNNQYLWVHWDARLTKDNIKTLCDWTKEETEKIIN